MRKPIYSTLFNWATSIPVERPIDLSKIGSGLI